MLSGIIDAAERGVWASKPWLFIKLVRINSRGCKRIYVGEARLSRCICTLEKPLVYAGSDFWQL